MWIWSALLTTSVTLLVVALEPESMLHWFLLPVWLCGLLITPDAIHWFRRQYDTFDPRALIGLLGETLLNFHLVDVPFAFLLFGLLLAQFRRWMDGLLPGDARWLLVPFFIHLGVVTLVADMDNIVVSVVKNGFVPFFVVILSAQRVRLPYNAASANKGDL